MGAINAEAIRYSKELALDRNRVEGELVRKLQETISSIAACDVLAAKLAPNQHFNDKHE